MSTVRTLLQRTVQQDMIVHQMDVKTAYLNAPIDCEIFIKQPEGFEQVGENGETLVWKLKKSLYGLKQSGRNWNNLLQDFLIHEELIEEKLLVKKLLGFVNPLGNPERPWIFILKL